MNLRISLVIAGCALVISCRERAPQSRTATFATCDSAEARRVVERFGGRLQRVSLLAPDSVVTRELRDAYASLVAPELLDTWTTNPSSAPGREVSSPWPARIEVHSVDAIDTGGCRVEGDIIYESSAPTAGAPRQPESVSLVVRESDGWRIVSYESRSQPSASSAAAAALTKNGERQRFEGTFVMRQSVVDGAPPSDRQWHIYRAALEAAQ
jgi:hypothetical protein